MKTPILITVAFLLAIVLPARAGNPALKAEVNGTVQVQILTSPSTGKIGTSKLSATRIFDEYGVAKSDYELVVDITNGGILELLPKHTSGGLPTIKIVTFDTNSAQATDTKLRIIKTASNITNPGATNLFKDLSGELSGSVHYNGSVSSPVFDKFIYSVVASGTDIASGDPAILKFKVIAKGVFTQAP